MRAAAEGDFLEGTPERSNSDRSDSDSKISDNDSSDNYHDSSDSDRPEGEFLEGNVAAAHQGEISLSVLEGTQALEEEHGGVSHTRRYSPTSNSSGEFSFSAKGFLDPV